MRRVIAGQRRPTKLKHREMKKKKTMITMKLKKVLRKKVEKMLKKTMKQRLVSSTSADVSGLSFVCSFFLLNCLPR